MMVRVLLVGAGGQLGRELVRSVPSGIALHARTSAQLDVRNEAAVATGLQELRPAVVINASGYTAVDAAEANESEAMAINAAAVECLAQHAHGVGARFVHISTDYVFDGRSGQPYRVDDAASPLNAYGRSKLAGEQAALATNPDAVVIRTAWLHSGYSSNFVATTVRRLRAGQSMQVVDDQLGTPTRAWHLAEAIWRTVALPDLSGLWHFTDAGVASWYDVAALVRDQLLRGQVLAPGATVSPVATDVSSRPARRPSYSVLSAHGTWAALGWSPTHWSEGVAQSVRELLDT